jgi:hypothetical protein
LPGEIFSLPERAGPDGSKSTPHSVSAAIIASYVPAGADGGSSISSFCVKPVNIGNAVNFAVIDISSANDAAEAEIKMTKAVNTINIFLEYMFVISFPPVILTIEDVLCRYIFSRLS